MDLRKVTFSKAAKDSVPIFNADLRVETNVRSTRTLDAFEPFLVVFTATASSHECTKLRSI